MFNSEMNLGSICHKRMVGFAFIGELGKDTLTVVFRETVSAEAPCWCGEKSVVVERHSVGP